MDGLDNDCYWHVQTFINVVDVIALGRTCRSAYGRACVGRHFRKRLVGVVARICCVNEAQANRFIANVVELGGVISGSTVLQVLLGETWSSDIDVYFNASVSGRDTDEARDQFVVDVLEVKDEVARTYYPDEVYFFTTPDEMDEKKAACGIFVIGHEVELARPLYALRSDYMLVYNYKHYPRPNPCTPFQNVQIIKMTRDPTYSAHRATTEHFDMSCVMNTWSAEGLEVYDIGQFIGGQKISYVYRLTKGDEGNDRYKKYEDRGFMLVLAHCDYPDLVTMFERCLVQLRRLRLDASKKD